MDTNDRDRKKAWKIQQKKAAQDAFPVANSLLEEMFDAVDAEVSLAGCDHTLRFTESWIDMNRQPRVKIIYWLRECGGSCDCEVIANAVDHWEKNR